jgi:bifunctional ADP-heptose synthase (sugar kinase/adenylyltransferase)
MPSLSAARRVPSTRLAIFWNAMSRAKSGEPWLGFSSMLNGEKPQSSVEPARAVTDPTGGGDAFRAGLLAGLRAKLTVRRAAQLGALLATRVLETPGTQEWTLDRPGDTALDRLREAYGAPAAAEIAPVLANARAHIGGGPGVGSGVGTRAGL